jgi:formate dehydrogenase major subunit/formate dehydrogenase alpha subunit
MYIMGENPIRSFPDGSYVREALGKLEFLAVQDLFVTETAKVAKVVLPGCSFAEKEGTVTNAERRVQRLTAAIPPAGKSLPDWKILTEVSRRMGLPGNYGSAREIMEEIHGLVPIYGGITYERLEKEGFHWPCFGKDDPGSPCLLERGVHLEKKILQKAPRAEASPGQREDQNLFQLFFGTTLFHSGSGTRSSRSPKLRGFGGSRKLRMNPLDAEKLELEEGSRVKVYSKKGCMTFSVSLDTSLLPGTLFLPVSPPGEESVYDLLPFPPDPKAEFPGIKTIEVKIERI